MCNIFGQVCLLNNFIFFECLYFSEYDIRMLLCVSWLGNRPSIKYVRNWGDKRSGGGNGVGGHPICLQVRTGGRELKDWSLDTYVLNG